MSTARGFCTYPGGCCSEPLRISAGESVEPNDSSTGQVYVVGVGMAEPLRDVGIGDTKTGIVGPVGEVVEVEWVGA